MATLLQDLRYAIRTLRKAPGFTAVAALTLAFGIAVNAAMFSILNAVLWRPLPVREPGALAVLFSKNRATGSFGDFSYADYLDFKEAGDVFEGLIAYEPVALSLSRDGKNERLWGEVVSGNYFDVLGVSPVLGRAFRADEDETRGAVPVALVSHSLWMKRFQSDPAFVGKTLRLNGRDFTVVGVTPREFHSVYYVGFRPDIWLPTAMYDAAVPTAAGKLRERGATSLRIMARLKRGVPLEQARARVATIARRIEDASPTTNAGLEAALFPERETRPEPGEDARSMSLAGGVFLGAVGLVLLIACANVANLLLARATARHREIAVRVAIGASRDRIVRQLLTESLLLAALGGALGTGLAGWATSWLSANWHLPTDIPFALDFGLDGRALAFTAAASLVTAVVFGLAPALQATQPGIASALKTESLTLHGEKRSRLRDLLVVGQVATSCLLLICAGLALKSLGRMRRVDPGFDTRSGLLATVTPSLLGYDEARGQTFYRQLLARVTTLPGVRSASLAHYVPLEFSANGGNVYVEGRETRPGQPPDSVFWSVVAPRYFETMGTRVLEGREFTAADDAWSPRVGIVNEAFAKRYWPGESPLGRAVRTNTPEAPPLVVVGVVATAKERTLTEAPEPHLYQPLAQSYPSGATLVVRGEGDARSLLSAIRETVWTLDPEIALSDVKTLEQLVEGRALVFTRFGTSLSGIFGVLALGIAMVGLYGVLSYAVGRRVREIGIRVALGASRGEVLRLVVGQGMRLAAVGMALGIAAAVAVARLLSSLFYGVGRADIAVFAVVVAALAGVAFLASYAPARRATRIDPITTLRYE
jgi:predicted permease